jgi:uncharacterized protein YjbJ (UPF0337 family)
MWRQIVANAALVPEPAPFPREEERCLPARGGTLPSLAGWICSSRLEEQQMDWNRVEGNWKEMKGKVKEQWGKLTDDDLDVIAGKQDQLEGRLQQRYGYAKDQAQKEVNTWYDRQKW